MNWLQNKNKSIRKSALMILIVSVFSYSGYAQNNTFFIELQNRFVGQEIVEDSKGGIVASIDYSQYRFSPNGQLLWVKFGYPVLKYHVMRDSNVFYQFSYGYPWSVTKYDLRGNILLNKYDDQKNETNGIMDFLYDSVKNIFVVCGMNIIHKSNQNYNCWIAGMDLAGNILWENKVVDSMKSRFFNRIYRNNNSKGYVLLSIDENYRDLTEWFQLDSVGKVIKQSPTEPSPEVGYNGYTDYPIQVEGSYEPSVEQINDSIIIATIIKPDNQPYFYKYNTNLDVLERKLGGASKMERISDNSFVAYGGTGFVIFDINMVEKYRAKIFENDVDEFFYIYKLHPSKDGGFIGTVVGSKFFNGKWEDCCVYVFKTDSLGRYQNSGESFEKLQPAMLQPNPARDSVRVAIPFYYGQVNVKIYSSYGQLLQESTQNELDRVSLNGISPGVYFVHATIEETKEVRKMKLVVR